MWQAIAASRGISVDDLMGAVARAPLLAAAALKVLVCSHVRLRVWRICVQAPIWHWSARLLPALPLCSACLCVSGLWAGKPNPHLHASLWCGAAVKAGVPCAGAPPAASPRQPHPFQFWAQAADFSTSSTRCWRVLRATCPICCAIREPGLEKERKNHGLDWLWHPCRLQSATELPSSMKLQFAEPASGRMAWTLRVVRARGSSCSRYQPARAARLVPVPGLGDQWRLAAAAQAWPLCRMLLLCRPPSSCLQCRCWMACFTAMRCVDDVRAWLDCRPPPGPRAERLMALQPLHSIDACCQRHACSGIVVLQVTASPS